MKKNDTDILREILGHSLKEIFKLSNDIYRYLWEQVISVCIYSRAEYLKDATRLHFQSRIRLVHCLCECNGDGKKAYGHLLELLESGISSYDLVEEMKKMDLKNFVNKMEELNIVFPKSDKNHYFSYLQMYESLSSPIRVFKKLLTINVTEDYLAQLSLRFFLEKEKNKPYKRTSIHEYYNPKTLAELYLERKREMIGAKEHLLSYLYKRVLNCISGVSSNIFDRVSKFDNYDSRCFFEKNVSVLVNEKDLNINIDKDYLSSMIGIGQYESLISSVHDEILLKFNGEFGGRKKEVKFEMSAEESIKGLSKWQKVNSLGIIKRIDQCPRMVATIMKFDIDRGVGICDSVINPYILSEFRNEYKNSRSELVTKISRFIKYFLFYDYTPGQSLLKNNSPFDHIGILSKDFQIGDLDSSKILPCKMMEDWCSDDLKKTTELFKKIPNNIFHGIDQLIGRQIESSKNNKNQPLPLNTKILLPFWVKV